ncbi:hypothetical protein HOLleu_44869 [Holothuria leucospilota]|uniref:Uncharacterized protein n=1 Tax=Holothuria leucospilota TaxID=206669 RepID=A0A9Q0YA10_HOLLE|nr:hypothetical protein HOLleu_44869 [Holothuria leucospilota]
MHSRFGTRSPLKELLAVASCQQAKENVQARPKLKISHFRSRLLASCFIPVPKLWLYDSYSKVDLGTESVQLKSKIAIPALTTLKELWIQETGGENSIGDITDILQYSLKCEKLKKLW